MGIGRPALSNFLNGKASLSHSMAIRLEKTFGANKKKLLELQQQHDKYRNQDTERKVAVKGYTPSFLQIHASQIEAWADRIETRSLLAALIRRLVISTTEAIIRIDFPAFDNSQTPGWDGLVESNSTTPWVPSGTSGWEFGCDKEAGSKANKDYHSRTKSIAHEERSKTTFIFVTPRKWPGKAAWVKKKNTNCQWKEVRAYDAGDLEQWLEQSISAQVWLAEHLGIPNLSAQSLGSYWKYWSETAKPPISTKIFDNAVAYHSETMNKWLNSSGEKPFIITGSSKEEAKAFLYCLGSSEDGITLLVENSILVSSPETIQRLASTTSGLIFIVDTEEGQQALIPHIGKHHVIIIADKSIKRIQPDISLIPPNFESFQNALKEMGYDEAQIETYRSSTRYSPTILRRQLTILPSQTEAAWTKSTDRIQHMIPLILAGSWNSDKNADKEILKCLSNIDNYEEIETQVAGLEKLDDSPIWRQGHHRGVISVLDCLFSIADDISEQAIKNFIDVAEYILSEDDPALDMSREDRWTANLYNKVRDHSNAIRKGIRENLIILAVYGNALFGERLNFNVEYAISALIKRLLHNKNARAWQAQRRDLPEYAEAAPEVFLEIIEEEFKKEPPAFYELFAPAENSIFSNCDRTGMLWALELLAWEPNHLSRVAIILSKLSSLEINDNWANKPFSSLRNIFLYWRPHTAASVAQRCTTLEMLCKKHPTIGWKLCVGTITTRHDSTSGNYMPRWRSSASGALKSPNKRDAHVYISKCMEIVLQWTDHSKDTLKDLVSCMILMEQIDREQVIRKIKCWLEHNPNNDDILELREYVRTNTMTSRALKRQKANDQYVGGKELFDLLEPKDVIQKYEWLFARSWVEYTPEELEVNFDHDAREKGLARQRISALIEIKNILGTTGLIELCKNCEAAQAIGHHLYRDVLDEHEIKGIIEELLSNEDASLDSCIAGMLFSMQEKERTDLILRIHNQSGNTSYLCRLLQAAPFDSTTWELLNKQDEEIKKQYWKNVHPGWNRDEDINYAVEQLLKADRLAAAYQIAHIDFHLLDTNLIFDLLNGLATQDEKSSSICRANSYELMNAFEVLGERPEVDLAQLARLEFTYAPAFGLETGYRLPNLSKLIAQSPIAFVQMLAYVYEPQDGHTDNNELSVPADEEKRSIAAENAYEVLQSIDVIPGTQDDGHIDIDILRDWVEETKELAEIHGRGHVVETHIGELLSKSPSDEDGLWPTEEVCLVIDEIGSNALARGLATARYIYMNMRIPTGNSSEKEPLPEQYMRKATQIMNIAPFTAKILRELADMYSDSGNWLADKKRLDKRLGKY
ncbi:MAG: HigA family addiction module antitoxin [Wenzhouxiangellaceae bacterium]